MKKLLDIKYDINIFKIIVLSLPFSIIYFINITNISLLLSLSVISIFGLYFLFIVWLLHKQNLQGSN